MCVKNGVGVTMWDLGGHAPRNIGHLMVLHFGNDLYVPKWEGGESSMSLPKEVLLYGN